MDAAFVDSFDRIVVEAAARLRAITDDAASTRPAPGKWSPKEIVGHLIDSAVNNQARFVRAQLQDDLVFSGYDQDGWVRVQRYDERSWPETVQAWHTFNTQIVAVIGATPAQEFSRPRERHNLHEIGFQQLPDGTPATLGFLMRDYVAHIEHHLKQVLGGRSLTARPLDVRMTPPAG